MHIQAILAAVAAGAVGISSLALGQQRVGPIYPQNPNSPPPESYRPPRAYSGYDPFQFDAATGRFYYTPIPYQSQWSRSGYSPWQYNWYSGQWNYQSVPPEVLGYGYTPPVTGPNAKGTGGPASNYLGPYLPEAQSASAQIGPSIAPPAGGTGEVTPGAVPVPKAVPINPSTPAPLRPPMRIYHTPPATRPTTAPLTTPPRPPSTMPSLANRYPTTHPAADRDSGGWITINGLTGRWEYDYARKRWVFVLPPDR